MEKNEFTPKEPSPPFRDDLLDMETPHKNYEARIKELESQGFVVKEIKIEHEDILEAAKEKYKKSIELLKENGFGEFLPETFVLVGEGLEGKPSIYIVQEKIEGRHYNEIIGPDAGSELMEYYKEQIEIHSSSGDARNESRPDFEEYPHRDILEQADELAVRSLELWEKTRNLPSEEKKKLPMVTAFRRETRRPGKNEGLMPETMNPINMVWGKRPGKDEADRLFLIDTGLVAPDSDLIFNPRFPDGTINDVQRNLERSLPASLLDRVKKKLIKLSDEETYNEFADTFPSKSSELYEQLREKYSKNAESDEK